ncbi:MAG: thiamine phosphate synthase [Longimicrobiales bacterium]
MTDDAVLARPDFVPAASDLLRRGGAEIALHLRGRATGAAVLHALACPLRVAADRSGSLLIVNDRIDVALACEVHGVHLGEQGIETARARELVGPGTLIGRSVHSVEAVRNAEAGTDYLFLGTILGSRSHPEVTPLGPAALAAAVAVAALPVLAIGGVRPETMRDVLAAGGWGAAMISGIWEAADPCEALAQAMAATASVA